MSTETWGTSILANFVTRFPWVGDYAHEYVVSDAPFVEDPTSLTKRGIQLPDREKIFTWLMHSPSMTQSEFDEKLERKVSEFGLSKGELKEADPKNLANLQVQLDAKEKTLQVEKDKLVDPKKMGWFDSKEIVEFQIDQLKKAVGVLKKQIEVANIKALRDIFIENKPLGYRSYSELVYTEPKYHSIQDLLLEIDNTEMDKILNKVVQRIIPKLNHGFSWFFRHEHFDVIMASIMDKLGEFVDHINAPAIVEKGKELAAKQKKLAAKQKELENKKKELAEITKKIRRDIIHSFPSKDAMDKKAALEREIKEVSGKFLLIDFEIEGLKGEYHQLVQKKLGIQDLEEYRKKVAHNTAKNLGDVFVQTSGKHRNLLAQTFYNLFFLISKKLVTFAIHFGLEEMLTDESIKADKEGLKGLSQPISYYLEYFGISPDYLDFLVEENLEYMIPYLFDHAITEVAKYQKGEVYIPDHKKKLEDSFSHLSDSAIRLVDKHGFGHAEHRNWMFLGGLAAKAEENVKLKAKNTLARVDIQEISHSLADHWKSFFVPEDKNAELLKKAHFKSSEEVRAGMAQELEKSRLKKLQASGWKNLSFGLNQSMLLEV